MEGFQVEFSLQIERLLCQDVDDGLKVDVLKDLVDEGQSAGDFELRKVGVFGVHAADEGRDEGESEEAVADDLK